MLQASMQAVEEGAASNADDAFHLAPATPPVPIRRPVRPHELGLPQRTEIDAFAIGLGASMDLAHGWDCENGAECVNRAYAGELFPTEAEARAAVRRYILDRCRQMFPHWEPAYTYKMLSDRDGLEAVHILRVEGAIDACYDYREAGCQLHDAFEQLRLGAGKSEAWSIARNNRSNHGALSARLPGATTEGHLFAFLTGCDDLRVTSVDTTRPPRL